MSDGGGIFAHERAYGYAYRSGEVVEFVNWKVTGVGLIDRPSLAMAAPPVSPSSAHSAMRKKLALSFCH